MVASGGGLLLPHRDETLTAALRDAHHIAQDRGQVLHPNISLSIFDWASQTQAGIGPISELWQATQTIGLRPQEMPMTITLETLQAEVLRLSPADRARLLDRLIASLDVDAGAEAAWDKLADEREQEMAVGDATAVPLDVAIARLEARFPG
jgi:hypothetical protein